MGDDVVLISSADATADEVYAKLLELDLLKRSEVPGELRFIASSADGLDEVLGRRFLGPEFGRVEYRSWND
jgi:glutamate racemase